MRTPNGERRVSVRVVATVLAVVVILIAVLDLLFGRAYWGTPDGDYPLLVAMIIFAIFLVLITNTRVRVQKSN